MSAQPRASTSPCRHVSPCLDLSGSASPICDKMRPMQVKSTIVAAVLLFAALFPPTSSAAEALSDTIVNAARQGDAKKAASLVARVSPFDARRALREAAQFGRLNVVQTLLAKGVDINGPQVTTPSGATKPFLGSLGLFAFWADGGKSTGDTPLTEAARAGHLEVVEWLVEHGAGLDLQGSANVLEDLQQVNGMTVFKPMRVVGVGNTALSAAVVARQTAVVDFLVKNGADTSRRVIILNAAIPGVHGFRPGPGADPRAVPYSGEGLMLDQGGYLKQSADGTVSTNVAINNSVEHSVRELMDMSVRELMDLSK